MIQDEPRSDAYYLVGLNDELQGKRFPLNRGLSLGRAVDADIFLPDPSVSRRHCRVDVSSSGCHVVDCSQRKGVFVNHQKVLERRLQPGDELTLGRFRLRLELLGSPADEGGQRFPANSADNANSELNRESESATLRMQGPSDDDCRGAARRSRGQVMAIKLSAEGSAELFPSTAQCLLEAVRAAVESHGGRLAAADPTCWRAFWDAHETNETDQEAVEAAVRSAFECQRLAFSLNRPRCRIRLSIGLAGGDLFLGAYRDVASLVWGPAADGALRLACSGKPSGVLLQIHDDAEATSGFDSLTAASPLPFAVCGLRRPATGRRHKFMTALRAQLCRTGQEIDCLIVRLNFDPHTGEASLTVACKEPLETGEEYVLVGGRSTALTFHCQTCQASKLQDVLRAQLSFEHPPGNLCDLFGFDPREMAGARVLGGLVGRRPDRRAAAA